APPFPMQGPQQGGLPPFALISPRRRQDRLIQTGAEGVASRQDDLVCRARRARLLLELSDLLEGVTPKTLNVDRRGCFPHLRSQQEQRARRLHERVQSYAE